MSLITRPQIYTATLEKGSIYIPRTLRNKKAQELIPVFRKYWNEDRDGTPKNKTTACLREVFRAIADPSDWKNPCRVMVMDAGLREVVKAAIIWYHGAEAIETWSSVMSYGYQCW